MSASPDPDTKLSPNRALRGPALFLPSLRVIVLLAPSLLWIAWDRTPWTWDPAWYGEVAVDLWWTLTHSPQDWWPAMIGAFGIKAPGTAWLGQWLVPLGHLLGNVDDTLLLLPLFAVGISLHLWFKIGSALWGGDERGGWLLAGLGAGSPLLVGITHQFFVEPLLLLGVSWLYWLALAAPETPKLRLATQAGLASVFLLAIKATSPAFCIVPASLIGWHLWRGSGPWLASNRRERIGDAASMLLLLAGTALTAAWYLNNLPALRAFIAYAAQSDDSLIYGGHPAFLPKWGFWLSAVHREFFHPSVGFILLPVALGFFLIACWRRQFADQPARRLAVAALLQVVMVIQGFALQIPEVTRYALPLLVSGLIPLAALLACGPRPLASALGLGLAAVQWVGTHAVTLNALPPAHRSGEWLIAANSDPSYLRELDGLIAATTSPAGANRYRVNGYELPWLNANTLAFHAAKHRLNTGHRCYYTSLGYGATDPVAAYQRVLDMQADFYISLAHPQHDPHPSFMNQTALPVLHLIQTDGAFAPEPFPSMHGIVLYRRLSNAP